MQGHETAPYFDLQSHSTYSDGSLPPAEVVSRAAAAGVHHLALTDHDTIDGVPEALDAAQTNGIRLTPAVELSSVHAEHEDLHVLGYALDHTNQAFRATLEDFRKDRVRRIFAMADRLRELGFRLDDAPLQRAAPGRPHLADALLAQNAERLSAEGIEDRDGVFPAYLVPGAPTYVPRQRPTVAEAIDVIHAANGLAVWAHPYWDVERADQALRQFAAQGLDGVEAFYVTHTEEQTRRLHALARELNLITTGSTDFHGPEHPYLNRFRGFALHGLEPDLGPLR
jgi:3',5'-nucleoside bisphosphate phosphatase